MSGFLRIMEYKTASSTDTRTSWIARQKSILAISCHVSLTGGADKVSRQGHKNISDLQEAYREKITKLRKQAIVPGATGPLEIDENGQISKAIKETAGF